MVDGPEDDKPRRHLLVADDEAPILDLLSQFLACSGFQVDGYPTGEEALAAFSADPQAYDLALVDLVMPGRGGVATMQALHAIRPELPVIIASGMSTDYDPAELRAAGACGLLEKPYDFTALEATLLDLL